jgi:hypothetical protein
MPPTPNLAQQINRYLKRKGSPLAGLGAEFVKAGRKYGVDPYLLVAISGAETSFGTYGPAQRIHNAWGWGPHIEFGSWQEGIHRIARGLREGYLNEGRTTVQQIGQKWAPIGAGNDPTNLNSNWAKNVAGYMRELGAGGSQVGPGRVPFQRWAKTTAAFPWLRPAGLGSPDAPADS